MMETIPFFEKILDQTKDNVPVSMKNIGTPRNENKETPEPPENSENDDPRVNIP